VTPIAGAARRRPPTWLLILATWVGVALFFMGQNVVSYLSRGSPVNWFRAAGLEFLYWTPWVVLTPALFWVARRFPLDTPAWARNVCWHLGVAVVFSALQTFLYEALWYAVVAARGTSPDQLAALLGSQRRSFPVLGLTAFYKYVLFMGVYYAFAYHRKYRERELRAATLEAELSTARLRALTMQLHPHFLFNALHSASMLALENPESASVVLSKVSDLLRRTLKDSGAEVTLEEELDFIDRYLEIERLRFADRLRVHLNIAPEAQGALVPSLILQPLVENAIRHGIGPVSSAGRIDISAAVSGGRLRLAVEDDGPGLPGGGGEPPDGMGIGLTRARLERRYGAEGSLRFTRPDTGGCRATITLPYTTAAMPAQAT